MHIATERNIFDGCFSESFLPYGYDNERKFELHFLPCFFAEFIKILNKAYDSVELLLIFKKLVSSKIILDKVSKVYYYTYIVSSDNILTKQCIFIRHKCRKGGYYGNTV